MVKLEFFASERPSVVMAQVRLGIMGNSISQP